MLSRKRSCIYDRYRARFFGCRITRSLDTPARLLVRVRARPRRGDRGDGERKRRQGECEPADTRSNTDGRGNVAARRCPARTFVAACVSRAPTGDTLPQVKRTAPAGPAVTVYGR